MEELKEKSQTPQEGMQEPQSVLETPKESPMTQNLALMRKKLEAEEGARREAERRAEESEKKLQSYAPPLPQESDDEDFGDPEDYVPAKKLLKTTKKFANKQSESDRKIAELEQKLQYIEAKSQLDSIKDFNEVVTDDNLKTFARLYPDDYDTVMANPNLSAKSKTVYNMIKNYGIAERVPMIKQAEQIRAIEKKIEANKSKPSSSHSAPDSGSVLGKYGRYDAEGRLTLNEDDSRKIQQDMRRKMGIM